MIETIGWSPRPLGSLGFPGASLYGATQVASGLTPWGAVSSGITSVADLAKTIISGQQSAELVKQQAKLQQEALEAQRQAAQLNLTTNVSAQMERQAAAQRNTALIAGGLGVVAVGIGVYIAYKALKRK